MANNLPDLTGAQVIEQFRQNTARLNLFVNGPDDTDVEVDSGLYPTVAKLVKNNQQALLDALTRQDVNTIYQLLDQKAAIANSLAGYGILDAVQTDDPRVGTTTIKEVRKRAGKGQFTTIAAALASITDASALNRYVIDIEPGRFVEDQLVLKQFVSIKGAGEESTLIEAADPTKHLLVGCRNTGVREVGLHGATARGSALVYVNDPDPSLTTVMRITSVKFCSGDTLALVNAGYIQFSNVSYGGEYSFRQGFIVENGNLAAARIVMRNSTSIGMTAPYPEVFARADGTNCQLSILATTARAKTAATLNGTAIYGTDVAANLGVHLRNGGYLRAVGASLIGFQKAIWCENTGEAPICLCEGTNLSDNGWDLVIDHPNTQGNYHGSATRSKVATAADLTVFTMLYMDIAGQGFVSVGPMFVGKTHNQVADIAPLITHGTPLGLMDGGVLSKGTGLNVNVTAGSGYARDAAGILYNIKWPDTSIAVPANATSYVYVDNKNVIRTALTLPDSTTNVILGRMLTSASGVMLLGPMGSTSIASFHPNLDKMLREAIGPVYVSGSIVSANASNPLAIDITDGYYYLSSMDTHPKGGVAVPMTVGYHVAGQVTLAPWTALSNTKYDNGTDLVDLPAGHFTKHVLYTNGNGANTAYFVTHGTGNFATLADAVTSPLPPPPLSPDGSPLVAAFVVQQGVNAIQQIIDLRPRMGFSAASSAATTNHGDLLGLANDDHKQYLLANGNRPMVGPLDMGGNNVTNVGTVAGVNVATHAARHLPNGSDPLTTAAAVGLNASSTNQAGTANSLARSDHTHAITGFQPSSAVLSAVAALTAGAAGVVRRAADGSWSASALVAADLPTNAAAVANMAAGSGFVRRAADNTWTASAIVAADLPANVTLPGTADMVPPSGTTAQRPGTGAGGMFRYNTTLGIHEGYTPDGWIPMNNVMLNALHGYIGQVTGTTLIPNDNTPPLSTEGTALWSKSVTPSRADSVIYLEFAATVDCNVNNRDITIAIFRDTTLVGFTNANVSTAGRAINMGIMVEDAPGTTNPVTYTCRIGADSSCTWCVGRTASTTQGGVNKLSWKILEMLP